MSDYLPAKPIWRRTGTTSTTPVAIFLPAGVRRIKVWVDALSYFGLGNTQAAPSVTVADEVITIITTGTPTGGDFTLTFDGQTTGAIAHNASAATIVTALNALSNVDSGDFVGAGGALPTAVTLTGGAVYDQAGGLPPLKVGTNALTGGTNPTVQVRTSTKGSGLGNRAGGYGYLEAESQELLDIGAGSSRVASGATQSPQGRYLYLATVASTGNYRVTGYILA
jgi:hypothetical protein